MYFISENSHSGTATQQMVRRLGESYLGVNFRYIDLSGLSWSEMFDRLETLTPEDAVLVLNIARDASGQT